MEHWARMNENELKKMLYDGGLELGLSLNPEALDRFLIYLKELKAWNRKINLTAITGDEDIIKRHFLDSLTVAGFLGRPRPRLLDIGAGGGFPGIPLKIAMPGLEVVLMDSVEKKVYFMRHVLREMGFSAPDGNGIQAVAGRAEDRAVIERYARSFDVVTSRAFSSLKDFLTIALPYCRPGGSIIAIKGPTAIDELRDAEGVEGVSRSGPSEVRVPFGNRVTTIIKFIVK